MRVKPALILFALVVLSVVSVPAFADSYYDPSLAYNSNYCWDGYSYVVCDGGIDSQLQYGTGGYDLSGGGGSTLITCKAGSTPETWCFSKSYDCSDGPPCVQVCVQTMVSSGWCQCVNAVLKGSCTML